MGPVAVVDSCESYAHLHAALSCEHHVGGVQGVNEVGRKR